MERADVVRQVVEGVIPSIEGVVDQTQSVQKVSQQLSQGMMLAIQRVGEAASQLSYMAMYEAVGKPLPKEERMAQVLAYTHAMGLVAGYALLLLERAPLNRVPLSHELRVVEREVKE